MGRVREGSRWGLPWLHDPEAKGEGGIGASELEEVIQRSWSSIAEMEKSPRPEVQEHRRAGSKQPLEKLGPSTGCPVSRALPWEESLARPDSFRLRWMRLGLGLGGGPAGWEPLGVSA